LVLCQNMEVIWKRWKRTKEIKWKTFGHSKGWRWVEFAQITCLEIGRVFISIKSRKRSWMCQTGIHDVKQWYFRWLANSQRRNCKRFSWWCYLWDWTRCNVDNFYLRRSLPSWKRTLFALFKRKTNPEILPRL
jgi:hypothetical protein